uniref:Uncharacterized protein n=1 Tax=Acrobeloides nanus TaxID=290746 RepID=A0A914EF05_9BILA
MKFPLFYILLLIFSILLYTHASPLKKDMENNKKSQLRRQRQSVDTWGNSQSLWSLPSFGLGYIGSGGYYPYGRK